MNRRELLKAFSLAGVMPVMSAGGLGLLSAAVKAETLKTPDSFWLFVAAEGGWDTTSLCDPKGNIEYKDNKGRSKGVINTYDQQDILSYGNIRFSPYHRETTDKTDPYRTFLEKYADKLLVINGIETGTNSHSIGKRSVATGAKTAGIPALPAMIAATHGSDLPLSFITYGYHDNANGIIARSRFSGRGEDLLAMTRPNRIRPDKTEDKRQYFDDAVLDIILSAQDKRLKRLLEDADLPVKRNAIEQLLNARISSEHLEKILDKMPSTLSKDNRGLNAQIQTACAGFASGLCASAMVKVGGFDTHSNHDKNHYHHCGNYLKSVDFLMGEAQRQGIADKLNIVMFSDFSRTPYYNKNQGKDHWTTTSMMFMGPAFKGNQVIGATNNQLKARKINPETLQPDDSGIILQTAHVHQALRKLAGVTPKLQQAFALPDLYKTPLDLFG